MRVANPTVYLDAYCLSHVGKGSGHVLTEDLLHIYNPAWWPEMATGFMLFIRKIDIWYWSIWYSTHMFHTCGSCHDLVTNETYDVEKENVTLLPLEDLHTFSHFESHSLPAFAPHQNLHMHPKSSSMRRAVSEAKLHMDRLVWTNLSRGQSTNSVHGQHRNQHLT